jgi:hypothetical protein
MWSSARRNPARSDRAPLAVSRKIFSAPASRNCFTCASTLCPSVDTRAYQLEGVQSLIDHGLLRAKRRERDLEVRERTITVRVREQTYRVFAVSKSILAWRGPSPARPDEILAARHAATMQHAMMKHASLVNGNGEQPDDRAFATILKAKTTILNSVLNAQVRIDETRFRPAKEDRLERFLAAAERSLSHLERAYGR